MLKRFKRNVRLIFSLNVKHVTLYRLIYIDPVDSLGNIFLGHLYFYFSTVYKQIEIIIITPKFILIIKTVF